MAKSGIRLSRNTLIFVGAIALIAILWFNGTFSNLGISTPSIPGVGEDGKVTVTKPIQFAVMDPLAGSKVVSATIKVYDGTTLIETLTTDATTGLASTSMPYPSGKVLNVQVSKTLYVTRWQVITVPKMSPDDAQSLTTNYVQLTTATLGTYAITVQNSAGTAYTTGDAINMTDYASTPMQLTVTLRNNVDNTGYISSYDPVNKVNLNPALLTSSSTSYMTIQNAGAYVPRGTVSNWVLVPTDTGLTKELVGSIYKQQGQQAFTITLYKGTLTSSANQTVTFDLYKYFDLAHYTQQGIGGPDAATAASQFSLTFYTA